MGRARAGEKQQPVLVWFRRDLRLADNPALDWAVKSGRSIIPVYIDSDELEARPLGSASRWWLERSLLALENSLKAKGSRLIIRSGSPPDVLSVLARETDAGAVAFSRLYDPGSGERERRVRGALHGLAFTAFNAGWLSEPGTLLSASGAPYRVFAPFHRALLSRAFPSPDLPAPATLRPPVTWPSSESPIRSATGPSIWKTREGIADWTPGEEGASARLSAFLASDLSGYLTARDLPGMDATSRLSPHLRFGEIAPWRVTEAASTAAESDRRLERDARKLSDEVAWREFAGHLLHHFPSMTHRSMRSAFDQLAWREDGGGLQAWREGQTGFPIVDAGMRQLRQTGWMHNRVRMIVASFLVKDLLIDWRQGEAWFWDSLIDADPANNPMNWQWAAGSGVDAAPFFRVFNPVLQGERHDQDGHYVRRWIPELSRIPARWLHSPWMAPGDVLATAGVRLGCTYPAPIVDHAAARRRALAAYRAVK